MTRKHKKETLPQRENKVIPPMPERKPWRLSDIIGIALIAGGLFNIRAMLQKPQTDAEWMMVTIVAALILSGSILFFLPRWLRKRVANKNIKK